MATESPLPLHDEPGTNPGPKRSEGQVGTTEFSSFGLITNSVVLPCRLRYDTLLTSEYLLANASWFVSR